MKLKKFVKISVWMTPVVVFVSFTGCTKKVPYDALFKEKVHLKSEIDTESEFLYVASSDSSSRDDLGAANADPYMQGQEKIVKFEFTENSLRVVEIDEETQLKSNGLNNKIVLEIPIKHIDYKCSEDRYGKCVNKEEENQDITWSKKKRFQPNFEKMDAVGLSLMPVESGKLWGNQCYQETSQKFVGYTIESDAINIQVEKTFTGTFECLRSFSGFNNMKDLQSRIVYHYSFTKLNSIASQKYQPINYPAKDESTFGFFSTEYRKYDIDYRRTEKMKKDFMNRWNPNRKVIDYYLSDNFEKPEYASIKKATQIGFERVNQGLKDAGIDMKLVLHKGGSTKAPGDARNSMIVLVEDPVVSGPLGYGPSVANPRTGEILSAKTVMYYGNLVQNLSRTYDEVVEELRLEQAAIKSGHQSAKIQASVVPAEKLVSESFKKQNKFIEYGVERLSSKVSSFMTQKYKQALSKVSVSNMPRSNAEKFKRQNHFGELNVNNKKEFFRKNLSIQKTADADDIIGAMSKGHCMYPAQLFPFDEAVLNGLKSKLSGDLKLWDDLTDAEKAEVIALIAPEIWVPTLIHELGHNLGLRHNFNGSEDKDNFYSEAELANKGVTHKIPYSSVMDYGRRELNLLTTLGKYDVAALRFGYLRKVEDENGKLIEVPETIKSLQMANTDLKLKDFAFCTDEHVEVNATCKRFDEGTSPVEVVQSLINSYHEFYKYRNLRNGRESFSVYSDSGYRSLIRRNFNYIRGFMESFERIRNRFGLSVDSGEFKNIPWLKEVKDAAILSGKFFVDVLKTPDLYCAFVENKNPSTVAGVLSLAELSNGKGTDCFQDMKLKPEYTVVGQGGKAFNSLKDPRSENNYVDQIDVRGIWIDKMEAARALFARRINNSSYDDFEENYLNIPEVSELIIDTVNKLLLGSVKGDMVFKGPAGDSFVVRDVSTAVLTTPFNLGAGFSTHWLDVPIDSSFAKSIGIETKTSFQEYLLRLMDQELHRSKSFVEADDSLMTEWKVVKTNPLYEINQNALAFYKDIGGVRYASSRNNSLANEAMMYSELEGLLSKLSKVQIDELLKERKLMQSKASAVVANVGTSSVVLKSIPTQFPQFAKYSTSAIVASASGTLPKTDVLDFILTILPASN